MDKVSIIVPVYNVEKYLDKCLDSIVNQTYKNLEIILIDDGSTDDSGKICEKYMQIDNRIIVIHNPNKGVSYSRNNGMDVATGKYVLFVDSDDYLDNKYVEKLILPTYKSDYDLVICSEYDVYIKEKKKQPRIITHMMTNNLFKDYYKLEWVIEPPYLKLFKLELIKKYNIRFLEGCSYCEDQLFNMEYFKYVKNYKYINEYLYYHIHYSNNSLGKTKNEKNYQMILYKLNKELEFLNKLDIDRKKLIYIYHIISLIDYVILWKKNDYKNLKVLLEEIREKYFIKIGDEFKYLTKKRKIIYCLFKLKQYRCIYYLFKLKNDGVL